MSFDPISAVSDVIGKVIDRVFPDPTQAAAAKLELTKLEQQGELKIISGQLEINKIEAGNSNLFVSGWRPFIGWNCGIGFAYAAIIEPISRFVARVFFSYTGSFPSIDTNLTLQVLVGLLGLGTLRTVEKIKKHKKQKNL